MGSDSLVRSLLTSGLTVWFINFLANIFIMSLLLVEKMFKLTALNVCAIDILSITPYSRILFFHNIFHYIS